MVFAAFILTFSLNAQITITTSSGDASFSISSAEPVEIDTALTVTSADMITAASVMITDGYLSSEDVLVYPTVLYGVTGTYDAQTGVLSLTGNATAAQYQEILRSIQYQNTNGTPSEVARGITFSLGSALPFYPCEQTAPHFYEYVEEHADNWKTPKPQPNPKPISAYKVT